MNLAPPSPAQITSAEIFSRGIAALDAAGDGDIILYFDDADLIGDDDYHALCKHARSLDFSVETNEDGDLFVVADADADE